MEASIIIEHWKCSGKQAVDDRHVNDLLNNVLPALLARMQALPKSAEEARCVVRSALGGEPFTPLSLKVTAVQSEWA
jgi:hypothetical protein